MLPNLLRVVERNSLKINLFCLFFVINYNKSSGN